jgi:hypothetical protein
MFVELGLRFLGRPSRGLRNREMVELLDLAS